MDLPVIRVLLVDDDEDSRVLIEDFLLESEINRFVLDWIPTYEEAVPAIARNEHDAYLIDYRLGVHTGLELVQEFAVQKIDKPFIMLTGFDDPETDRSALDQGVVDYLVKDEINARMLARTIRYAINIKRTQAMLREKIAELRATQAQIVQAEKLSALGTLVAGVAHELNNPLMGVLNYVEYVQRRVGEPKLEAILDKALRELHRAEDIVKNMLTFTHAPNGNGEQLARVNVREAVERALQLLAADFRHRHIEVSVDLPDSLPPVVGQLDGLQQVFLNLLSNARDALEDSAEKRIMITGSRQDRSVRIAVQDTGCGVPAHLSARIFDPFFTTKPPGKGTGLGMSVSRNILLGFGGALSLARQEGEGTTFIITLRTGEQR